LLIILSLFSGCLIVADKIILVFRLSYLAASWGGKDNGFGLSKCCSDEPISSFPPSATTLHFEFYAEVKGQNYLECSVNLNRLW
jgi:E3 ubiquitin-protein ligase HUWE1